MNRFRRSRTSRGSIVAIVVTLIWSYLAFPVATRGVLTRQRAFGEEASERVDNIGIK